MKVYTIDGKQDAGAIILARTRIPRESTTDKIAVVLDNASLHHAKRLQTLNEIGRNSPSTRSSITPRGDRAMMTSNTCRYRDSKLVSLIAATALSTVTLITVQKLRNHENRHSNDS